MKTARITIVILCLVMAGCSASVVRNPVPEADHQDVTVLDSEYVRQWGDGRAVRLWRTVESAEDLEAQFGGIMNTEHNYLVISGGGPRGAYGAGVLTAWTELGTRPEFTLVTGVSTGALTAPFAFLGPDYDDEMREVYTTTTTEDIARKRNPIAAAFSDSVTDTSPLQALIAKYIDAEMIDAIAREHKRGRRLFIGTVNLDAGRSVIWNIGAIANSDYPDKIDLIHELLRASAAIPVAFPPVIIPVEAEGKQYDELHVDGGTGSQVFVYPAAIDWKEITEKLKAQGKPQVYVIRNSFLDPDYQGIKRNVMPIASRTIDSLIRTQGIGDLYQIYALCRRDGNDFNLAYIPSDFTDEPTEAFDPVYMKKLLDRGYQMALEGYPWEKAPPGFIIEP